MKLAVMPAEPTWWAWLVTVVLLALGLAGLTVGFIAAIVLSLAQTIFFWRTHRTLRAMSVQIRLAYAALLLVCLLPFMRWLYWLPALGTTALLVFGYCLMARILSLLPWNRTEPLTPGLLRRTFFTAPAIGWVGQDASPCGGETGVCELEARVAALCALRDHTNLPPQIQTQPEMP
jgi:hypothetical protein